MSAVLGDNHRRWNMSEQENTTTKTIKIPGPAHPITIERNLKRVVVSIGPTAVMR